MITLKSTVGSSLSDGNVCLVPGSFGSMKYSSSLRRFITGNGVVEIFKMMHS